MKKLIALLLLACTVLCLCACGNTNNSDPTAEATKPQQTEAQNTEPQNTEPSIPEGKAEYTAYVVDEGGNPVANVMIQICKESCFPTITDAEGKATWIYDDTEGCKVSFPSGVPEGYAYVDETVTDFYFEGDSKEITVILKAIG